MGRRGEGRQRGLFDDDMREEEEKARLDPGESIIAPRPYQAGVVAQVVAKLRSCFTSVLIPSATGLGKTVMAGLLFREWLTGLAASLERNPRVLFIAQRREIVADAAATFKRIVPRLVVSVEQAERICPVDEKGHPYADIVCASVASLARIGRLYRFARDAFGLILVDEGHHYVAVNVEYSVVVSHFDSAVVVGQTATPDRGDGRSLAPSYSCAVEPLTLQWGIEDGWLTGIKVERPVVVDYNHEADALEMPAGSRDRLEAEEGILHRILDPVVTYATTARGFGVVPERPRPTIIFAPSVEASRRCAEILVRRHRRDGTGFAEHVDCEETLPADRAAVAERFKSGVTTYLCNYNVYGEGSDFPGTQIVVMARKSGVRAAVEQMVGRGVRPHPSTLAGLNAAPDAEARKAVIAASQKPFLLVVDTTGNLLEHKLIAAADPLAGWVDQEIHAAEPTDREPNAPRPKKSKVDREIGKAARERFVARTEFQGQAIDPFDVFDVGPGTDARVRRGKPATDKQVATLRGFGVPEEMLRVVTKPQARMLLDELFRRRQLGLCTFRQGRILIRYGYSPDVTFEVASGIIDGLASQGWPIPDAVIAAAT